MCGACIRSSLTQRRRNEPTSSLQIMMINWSAIWIECELTVNKQGRKLNVIPTYCRRVAIAREQQTACLTCCSDITEYWNQAFYSCIYFKDCSELSPVSTPRGKGLVPLPWQGFITLPHYPCHHQTCSIKCASTAWTSITIRSGSDTPLLATTRTRKSSGLYDCWVIVWL